MSARTDALADTHTCTNNLHPADPRLPLVLPCSAERSPVTAAIEVLDEEVEELPSVQPVVEATNETDATAAPAPSKSSAAGTSYSFAATVFALAVGAVLAL